MKISLHTLFSCLLIILYGAGCTTLPHGDQAHAIKQRVQYAALNMQRDLEQTINTINTSSKEYHDPQSTYTTLWLYDLELNVVAHPDSIHHGRNDQAKKDDNGYAYPQKILSAATGRKRGQRGWVNYVENGLARAAYFELAQGRDANYYIIVASTLLPNVEKD